jgi:hypothetical protein
MGMALKVQPNELDGWDVVREDEGMALSNHPTQEGAEKAARMRAEEERMSEEGDEPVVVDTEHVHHIDPADQGVKTAFFSLAGLLIAITILAAAIALAASTTGFGS